MRAELAKEKTFEPSLEWFPHEATLSDNLAGGRAPLATAPESADLSPRRGSAHAFLPRGGDAEASREEEGTLGASKL